MLSRALLAALALAVAAPATAHADATAVRDGAVVTVTGTDAAESVTALMNGATLALTGDVSAGPGCGLAGSEVVCGAGVTRVRMNLGGGDDSAAARRLFVICFPICPPPRTPLDMPLEFDGGPGDDTVLGGDADDVLAGGPGRDTFRLTPFGAADGADVVAGGDGIDEADYSLASPRVVVTLDDTANDGIDGDNDDVRSDVEDVTGTSGDDVIAGDADANQIAGGAGSDDLTGGGGFDALYGDDGVDLLRARDGNPERVDCGADNDFAVVDAFDRVSGCDSLDVSAALQADLDDDGFAAPADCDDTDPSIRPGVADAPDNGLDENCDGADATLADRDRDGVRAPADCDDGNAAIRPGAAEIFANAVDENCDGIANPLQTIESTVQSAFQAARRSTRVRRLRITQLRAGTTIRVECPGSRARRACRRKVTSVLVTRDTKRLDLRRRLGLHTRRPRANSRIVLWLRRPDSLARRVTFRFRSRRTPAIAERCAPPGMTRVSRCPTTEPD
jgi:hypothetical protein